MHIFSSNKYTISQRTAILVSTSPLNYELTNIFPEFLVNSIERVVPEFGGNSIPGGLIIEMMEHVVILERVEVASLRGHTVMQVIVNQIVHDITKKTPGKQCSSHSPRTQVGKENVEGEGEAGSRNRGEDET